VSDLEEWSGGERVLVYMVQHLATAELPPAPWRLTVTEGERVGPLLNRGPLAVVAEVVNVDDNETFLRELTLEVNLGASSPRAQSGELQGVMRALAKVVMQRRRRRWAEEARP
jgi:hypothetical protein